MEWRYDGLRACHELIADDKTIAARIYESEKPKNVLPFRAKSLISVYYYGERRLGALARKNKEWVTNRRKFKRKEERDRYIERRKQEVRRFIEGRAGAI